MSEPEKIPPPDQWTIHHAIGSLAGLAWLLDNAARRTKSEFDRSNYRTFEKIVGEQKVAIEAIRDRLVTKKGAVL